MTTGPRKFRAIFPGWEERKAMKASKFSDAQKAFVIRQGDDEPPGRALNRSRSVADWPVG